MHPMQDRVAVIGTGCRFPGSSNSPARLWELLRNPRDVASKAPAYRYNHDAFYHPDGKHHGTTNAGEAYYLTEDCRAFDAPFFNISSVEAEAIDPQQRYLMETVYEALESAGLRLEDLEGSTAAIFCGAMCNDYESLLNKDPDALPQYAGTGLGRSILANRLSYFFNWTGPSMTVDTACSASLVALHLAVKALNDRECTVATAAGTNFLLTPTMSVTESNLSMLAPDGRIKMWDAAANGYARGEGVAAVVLKRLEDAVRDGDPIECVIRAADINQDGRTQGITMPSSAAQARLIRSTYAKAGLDLQKAEDRCQYFEAHGTGTPAGDLQEAMAIHEALSPQNHDTLLVGSVKTIIGHTEGTAGLAGVIKTALALKNGLIPPNLNFKKLNPALKAYYSNIKIPTQLESWPSLPPGVPRRASVNSFGFGGTNAHVILEAYEHPISSPAAGPIVLPFVFSAPSERGLTSLLTAYSDYLDEHPDLDAFSLSWCLFYRRSTFTHKMAFHALSVEDLHSQITEDLARRKVGTLESVASRSKTQKILGVFTGQGAQWARMGYGLLSSSSAMARFNELEEALSTLSHPPSYSLLEQLAASKDVSRVVEAAISQPLCTAIQIILVDLLREAGISFSAVVGHSSGEIGAAYAAGILNAAEAIRIAYYRGYYAHLAGSQGKKGSMLAAGISWEEAAAVCNRPNFRGRIQPAAANSPSSITISGDADAIVALEATLKAEGKFARVLKVDTAYHSHHMHPCSGPYVSALQACKVQPRNTDAKWFSSVLDGKIIDTSDSLEDTYWRDNMVQPVLFMQALKAALKAGEYDMAIEVGPHPALKGPALQTVSDLGMESIPYTGVLQREFNDMETFTSALSLAWTQSRINAPNGHFLTQFSSHQSLLLKSLPNYPFDKDRLYWAEARRSKDKHQNKSPRNTLLGVKDSELDEIYSWRNFIKPSEIDWLSGHSIQSQITFPATGFVAMALEAARAIAGTRPINVIEIENLRIHRAMTLNDSWGGVEALFTVQKSAPAHFTCYADQGGAMVLCAEGNLHMEFGPSVSNTLLGSCMTPADLQEVDPGYFYETITKLGLEYTGLFKGIATMARRSNVACGTLKQLATGLMLHPALMDSLLQTLYLTYGQPEDSLLLGAYVPTSIQRIVVNPHFCAEGGAHLGEAPKFDSTRRELGVEGFGGDVNLFDSLGQTPAIQIEGVHTLPLNPLDASTDREFFSRMVWGPMVPEFSRRGSYSRKRSQAANTNIYPRLGDFVSQIAFRYPRMNILQVGTDQGDFDRTIIDRIGSSYLTYTCTQATATSFERMQKDLSDIADQCTFKQLKVNVDPEAQGYEKHKYDVLVFPRAFAQSDKSFLAYMNDLVKPGGYFLFLSEVGPSDTTESKIRSQWEHPLQESGFCITEISALSPFAIVAAQAVDDNIQALRKPLEAELKAEDLLIVGGQKYLAASIASLLSGSFRSIQAMPDWESVGGVSSPIVLSLAELEAPMLYGINQRRLEAFKHAIMETQTLLWLSSGAACEALYDSAVPAMLRCIALEQPTLQYQCLNIEDSSDVTPVLVAEMLLRMLAVNKKNDVRCPDMLWTTEPQISLFQGKFQIPRVCPDERRNNRFASTRRTIRESAIIARSRVRIQPSLPACDILVDKVVETNVRVQLSTFFAIPNSTGAPFHLVVGTHCGRTVLAASATSASAVQISPECMMDYNIAPQNARQGLAAAASYIIADYLVSRTVPHSTLLVHGADEELVQVLNARASPANVRVFHTSSSATSDKHTFIHSHSTTRQMKNILPGNITLFANLDTETSRPLCSHLRGTVYIENWSSLCSAASDWEPEDVKNLLQAASQCVTASPAEVLDAGNLPQTEIHDGLRLIDWTLTTEISARMQPSSSDVHLSPKRTYLLVGMTGNLGRSLCEWMISRGARNIVLTSRKPNVSQQWLDEMTAAGAFVKPLAMDVTDRDAISATDALIRESMPPVGGVVNGAMVLKDALLPNVTIDTLNQTLRPKVEGSQLLSDFYWDAGLEFFILFGSIAAVTGNRGQSAYAAANAFMSSLIQKRRKHGQPGSIICPGGISGVGVAARGPQIADSLASAGLEPVSELDLYELFAEAILAEGGDCDSEFVAGLRMADPALNPDLIWSTNPVFWNFADLSYKNSAGDGGSSLSLLEQIQQLSDPNDGQVEIVEALTAELRSRLKLAADEIVAPSTPLVELGVDSLVAVNLRTWALRELSWNLPVLKIISGSSLAQLAEEAVAEIQTREPAVKATEPKKQAVETSWDGPGTNTSSSSENASTASQDDTITSCSSAEDNPSDQDLDPKINWDQRYRRLEKLSHIQLHYWKAQQEAAKKTANNLTRNEQILGTYHTETLAHKLRTALQSVIHRHEGLRTCYVRPNASQEPRQAVLGQSRTDLQVFHAQSEEEAEKEFTKLRDHVYDIETGDVAQIWLVAVREDLHYLMFGFHHIAVDFSSIMVFLGELEAAFTGNPLPPVSMQYIDYAREQTAAIRKGHLAKQFAYWRSELANPPEALPLLPMAKTQARSELQTWAAELRDQNIDANTASNLRAACRQNGCTPFHFFVASLRLLILQLTGREDVCIGFNDANRRDERSSNVIGNLYNRLPLRFTDTRRSFRSLLVEARDKSIHAMENGDVPFDAMLEDLGVKRDNTYHPLYQAHVNWHSEFSAVKQLGGLATQTKDDVRSKLPYDLSLLVTDAPEGMRVRFRLPQTLFDAAGTAQFATCYMQLLELVSQNLDASLTSPSLVPASI